MKPCTLSKAEFAALLARIEAAPTLQRLEYIHDKNWSRTWGTRQEKAFRAAVTARSWQLLAAHPLGKYVPRITSHGRRWHIEYLGQSTKTGVYGNSAGARWAWSEVVGWVQKVGGFRKENVARAVCDWVHNGYPHRALRWISRKGAKL